MKLLAAAVEPPRAMQVLHAVVPIDPQHHEEAIEFFSELGERSRAEDGVVEYRATMDVDDRNVFRFVEVYEDGAALEAHTGSEHFREFEERVPGMLDGEMRATVYDVDGVTDLDV